MLKRKKSSPRVKPLLNKLPSQVPVDQNDVMRQLAEAVTAMTKVVGTLSTKVDNLAKAPQIKAPQVAVPEPYFVIDGVRVPQLAEAVTTALVPHQELPEASVADGFIIDGVKVSLPPDSILQPPAPSAGPVTTGLAMPRNSAMGASKPFSELNAPVVCAVCGKELEIVEKQTYKRGSDGETYAVHPHCNF